MAPNSKPVTPPLTIPEGVPDVFRLDEQKIQPSENTEKQELYVLQWLAQVERELKSIDIDILKKSQPTIEKTLLRLISLATAKPRRPIRFLIGRCYVILYTKGETRSLFDTVTAMHSLISANKNIDKETKIAAITTTGAIMGSSGGQVLSLFAETAMIFLKVMKSSNSPLLMKLETVTAFTLLLKGAGKAATDQILKDLMKQLRNGLVDKALVMRVASAQCLQAVMQHATQSFTQHDVETLLQHCFKAFEISSFPVRRAISSTCATILVFTQTQATVDPNKPNVKHASTGEGAKKTEEPLGKGTTLMSIEEMLLQLSTCYNRLNASRELKTSIIETYATLFILLGTEFVEAHYATISKHILSEILDSGKISTASDGAYLRSQVNFLLHNTIGKRLLSEQGQASAIRLLVNNWIKKWPPLMANQSAPNKHILVCVVNLVSELVCELEGAANSVQDVLVEPLFVLLTHTSFAVQMAAVWCIRSVCNSVPSNLLYLLPKSLNLLEKNLSNLTNQTTTVKVFQRTIAYSYTVAAIMSVFPSHPIYTSFELSARSMSLASQLVKQTNKDPKVASVQVQVAWTLIGSVMCLGPNLVKIHLPQLLLLWKSALPKPTGKEANAIRSESEWSFLFHTRECVISSIYSFLAHNSQSLVTLDIAKRVAALLNNTLAFLATAPTTFAPTTLSPCVPYETRLIDQFYTLRRRIFQCFITIRPSLSTYESSLSGLLRNSLSVFTETEKISASSGTHQQVTATVPGQFVSVWNAADGHGYGVTSKMRGYHIDIASHSDDSTEENNRGKEWMTRDRFERIEELLERPIIGSLELDPYYSYTSVPDNASPQQRRKKSMIPQPASPSTSYIDASIELFSTLFANQPAPIQESTFEVMLKLVKDPKLEKNSPKRAAILANVVVALLGAFKNNMAMAKKRKGEAITFSPRATQLAQEILMEVVVHPDPYLRNAASDTIGRLTYIVGGSFVAAQMQLLVDLVVSNRDPDVRAGCALAIGYIYSYVGGMASAAHLKTIVGILLSLSSDPHPVVHAWALEAMAMTVSAAGLMFSGYVNSTLGMVAKLYLSETHEPGNGSIAVSNAGMSVGFTAYQEFGRIIYELIGTLGPELQASSKVRELCLNMVEELKLEPDERVNVEAIRCIQHFLMFAPKFLDTTELVPYLQNQISSLHLPLKKAAVTCLYQLVQRDSELVFKAAQPGLDTELFKMLDTDPQLYDVKNVIRSWLQETAVAEPSVWVNITKRIVTGSSGGSGLGGEATKAAPVARERNSGDDDDDDFGDDDAEGFVDEDNVDITTTVADASGMTAKLSVNVEIPPRWRTQLFALDCLHQTIELISASGIREHFDLIAARRRRQQAGLGDFLVFRVPDLIRLSFTAATAHVNELRLAGINLLKLTIEKFATTLDADLEGMSLLEQYSAQIGAALTPAFGADSSSEIVSAAVRVCAIYVGSGIVKDLYQLGRVLKLLISALNRCKGESKLTGVGEVKDLSPHASVMVKLSVLNAWAELQVASQKQNYLKQVLQPNLAVLSPMWLRALQDYARIRLESDIVALSSRTTDRIQASSNSGIDSMYSAATKDVVLPYYRRSWLKIMEAVATLIETQAPSMTEAINSNPDSEQSGDHPSNLFYILFGLCIESLSRISNSSSSNYDNSSIPICLKALRTFVQPSLAGKHFVSKAVFLELMNVFDRLIQTEGYRIQLIIIEIIQRLIQTYGSEYLCNDLEGDGDYHTLDATLEPDAFPATAKLYYLSRLLINVFLQNVPKLSSKPASSRRSLQNSKENLPLLLGPSLDTLALLVGITPNNYKVDLLAICFYVFAEVLTEKQFESTLAPRVLVSLKTVFHNFETDLSPENINSLAKVTCAMIHTLLDDFFSESDDKSPITSQKNRLLAVVLIMTGCPQATLKDGEGRGLFVEILKKSLVSSNTELSVTAHQCLRNFISLPEKKSSVPSLAKLGQAIVNSTLAFIISRVLEFKDKKNDSDETTLVTLDQDTKTLLTLITAVHEEQKSLVLSIVLPTFTCLLDEPPYSGRESKVHEATLVHLLSLATGTPAIFRDTVSKLPGHVRNKLETAMRYSILASQQQQQQQQQKEQQRKAAYEDSKQPTIALKMDFSNFG